MFPSESRAPTSHTWLAVQGVSSKGISKALKLEGGRRVFVHAFACVGKGDMVMSDESGAVYVRGSNVSIPVSPAFQREVVHKVADGIQVKLLGTELVEETDFEAFHALSQFHYRTERSFGRRTVLLLTAQDSRFPRAVGFVEITAPFLHLRNRNLALNAPFAEPGQDVSWVTWDLAARRKYINAIARISRVVVHPELRGLGLSRTLLETASVYAAERWHVGGLRPLFIEITADMLRFMPFVSGTGLRYIGVSEGNVGRLAKDMAYLDRAKDRDSSEGHSVLSGRGKGILRVQKRDIELVTRLRDELAPNETIGDFVGRLLSSEDVDSRASELLMPLLRHPKPTYLKGLTPSAEAFLTRRTTELKLTPPNRPALEVDPYSGSLVLDELTLSYEIDTGSLTMKESGAVRRAFGLERSFEFRTGITNLSVQVKPGEICYLYGASGSGKTTLLRLLTGDRLPLGVRGSVRMPNGARIGLLEAPHGDRPLIAGIGARTLEEAIYALNSAGLSEPRLYLSEFDQLSAGQQYRASLARLICSGANVWLLDEFAAGLDDATSLAVGRNFAKAARLLEVILVVATVRRTPLVNAMAPDVVVHLTQLESPLVTRTWRKWAGVSS